MKYYIIPKSIPTIGFAHHYSSDSYCIEHRPRADFLEITFIECGDTVREFSDGRVTKIPSGSISTNIFSAHSVTSSKGAHRHCTVGIEMKYEIVKEYTPGALVLYDVIDSEEFVMKAGRILHACVNDHLIDRDNSFGGSAYIFELFALYNDHYKERTLLKQNPTIQPSLTKYVRLAQDYISLHIREKIRAEDVAASVNLSYGYLSGIFKQILGVSMIRYINEMKLQLIQDLVLNTSATLAEACLMVGIDDPFYASRMFRKYYGTTLRNIKASKPQIDRS